MTNDEQQTDNLPFAPVETDGKAVPALGVKPAHSAANVFAQAEVPRPKRTVGERLVDTLVYPVINNVGVFAISVGATYLTHRGDTIGKEGVWIRDVGAWFKRRGDWMKGNFEALGMSPKNADMSKMVFFSFFDGTFIAPFVKVLEDRRENMAKWIDQKLNTKPNDDFAYKVEPKQSWGSVIKGRLLTSLIVVPTAVALDKTKLTMSGKTKNFNDHMFDGGGDRLAGWFERNTRLSQRFPKLDLPYLSKTMVFEAFYTSVCTAGLYFISRAFAKHNRPTKEAVHEYINQVKSGLPADTAAPRRIDLKTEAETPAPHVTQTTHQLRVTEPKAQELTA